MVFSHSTSKLSVVRLLGELRVLGSVAVDSVLHFSSECLDESLNWPGSSITKSADGVTLNLVGELFEHVNFGEIGISLLDSLKDVNHPAGTLSAWSALSATFVLVELGESEDGIDHISLLIHNNNSGCTETTLPILEIIEVHKGVVALCLGQ